MTKQEILDLLKKKNIISKNNKKKFCWKSYWDDEINDIFNEFKKQYRSEDEAWFCLLNNIEPYHCEVCGNLAKFTGTKKTKNIGYNCVCDKCNPNLAPSKLKVYHDTINKRSNEERHVIVEKRKKTNLEKHGDENYNLFGSQSFKDNMKKKYGVEYNTQVPEIKEKIKQTNIEKYGVPCNLMINSSQRSKQIWEKTGDKIREKIKETSLKRYGVESPNQTKEKQDAVSKTKAINVRKIEEQYNCTQQRKLFKKYGQGWKSLGLDKIVIDGRKFISNEYLPLIEEYFNTKHIFEKTSNKEKELVEYIKSIYNGKVEENILKIVNYENHYYELDVYLPKLSLAFEFNGIYWHSSKFKDKYYHQDKTIKCYKNGIQLVHIWENDWINNRSVIEQRIIELLNGKDCSQYNWVSTKDIENYILTEPEEIHINNLTIFNEGKFIKK